MIRATWELISISLAAAWHSSVAVTCACSAVYMCALWPYDVSYVNPSGHQPAYSDLSLVSQTVCGCDDICGLTCDSMVVQLAAPRPSRLQMLNALPRPSHQWINHLPVPVVCSCIVSLSLPVPVVCTCIVSLSVCLLTSLLSRTFYHPLQTVVPGNATWWLLTPPGDLFHTIAVYYCVICV